MSEAGNGDVNRLERRARLLLRAYPPAYRAERGGEIVGTLLEATPPGRGRPPAREAASVITAGLRARRDANLRQGMAASLRQAAILGIAVFLMQVPCDLLFMVIITAIHQGRVFITPHNYVREIAPAVILVAVILAAVWHGRRWLVTVPPVVAATAAIGYYLVSRSPSAGNQLLYLASPVVLALAVLAPLTSRAHRPPRVLLWLPCLPLGVALLEALTFAMLHRFDYPLPLPMPGAEIILSPYTTYQSLITVAVAVCWLVTDVRPLAGLVLAFLLDRVVEAFTYTHVAPASPVPFALELAIAIAVPLVLACTLVWLLRRRIRTSPPAAT